MEDYINRHTVMGMMSRNYSPFPDWRGFWKNKARTRAVVFDRGFEDGIEHLAYAYMPEKVPGGYSSTLLVSRFDPNFFLLRGKEHREIREARNKWRRLVRIKDVPEALDDATDLVDRWDAQSGGKYGWNRHSGYDRNFFRRYWEEERGDLRSLFFYRDGRLVAYSVASLLGNDRCYRYVIRKCDISAGRNLCLYVDYAMFESLFDGAAFFVNWGASAGGVLAYKRKFPIHSEKKVYFGKARK